MSDKAPIGKRVRAVLLANPDGLTIRQIAAMAGASQDLVISALERNYGFYVSGWQLNESGFMGVTAIWRCVVVPSSPPKPKITEDMQAYQLAYRRAHREKLEAARIKRMKEMRETAKVANARLRAEREAQKAAEKAERQRIRAEQEAEKERAKAEKAAKREAKRLAAITPAAPANYQPKMTRWAFPPPWAN